MTTQPHSNDSAGSGGELGLGPVVEIWVDDHDDGSQSVFVTGERSDGQRFFGSFYQPTFNQQEGDSEW